MSQSLRSRFELPSVRSLLKAAVVSLSVAVLAVGCARKITTVDASAGASMTSTTQPMVAGAGGEPPSPLPSGDAEVGGALTPVVKSDAEWKRVLTPQQFHVLREKGTERPFGPLNAHKGDATFVCAACGLPLFDSKTKFDSGTGWPSFYAPLSRVNVKSKEDREGGMARTEVLCARCGGHLGHVFDDGPRPTGLRYCINGVSLKAVPKKK